MYFQKLHHLHFFYGVDGPPYSSTRRREKKNGKDIDIISVFDLHCAVEILKCNNNRSFKISVGGKLGQGSHMVIATPSFTKSSVSKIFPPTQRRKNGVCKFLRFQERSRISVDGRPNRRNTAAFLKFLRRCVDPAFVFKDVNTR